jgi:hypothetical protein
MPPDLKLNKPVFRPDSFNAFSDQKPPHSWTSINRIYVMADVLHLLWHRKWLSYMGSLFYLASIISLPLSVASFIVANHPHARRKKDRKWQTISVKQNKDPVLFSSYSTFKESNNENSLSLIISSILLPYPFFQYTPIFPSLLVQHAIPCQFLSTCVNLVRYTIIRNQPHV